MIIHVGGAPQPREMCTQDRSTNKWVLGIENRPPEAVNSRRIPVRADRGKYYVNTQKSVRLLADALATHINVYHCLQLYRYKSLSQLPYSKTGKYLRTFNYITGFRKFKADFLLRSRKYPVSSAWAPFTHQQLSASMPR
jgi:hypothetical protein